MAKILKVVGMDNKGDTAIVHVIMEDGLECTIWIGGECETYFWNGQSRAFVRKKGLDKQPTL